MMGVSRSTLRGWGKKNLFKVDYRTEEGHRRYSINKLLMKIGKITGKNKKEKENQNQSIRVVTYARVSSSKQRY